MPKVSKLIDFLQNNFKLRMWRHWLKFDYVTIAKRLKILQMNKKMRKNIFAQKLIRNFFDRLITRLDIGKIKHMIKLLTFLPIQFWSCIIKLLTAPNGTASNIQLFISHCLAVSEQSLLLFWSLFSTEAYFLFWALGSFEAWLATGWRNDVFQ